MSNVKYYIDKDELWSEIRSYYEADAEAQAQGLEPIQMHNKLGSMINDIAEKIMTSRSFSGYPYNDQMIGDAIMRMVKILTEKKFNLYTPLRTPLVKDVTFRGLLHTKTPIPRGCFVVKGHDKYGKEAFWLMEPLEDRFLKDPETSKFIQAFAKTEHIDAKITMDKNELVTIKCFVETGRRRKGGEIPVIEEGDLYDESFNKVLVRSNAFGYLSLISNREAITRIKKEGRNFKAVSKYQEEEFTKFLIENPEMSPQRIDDDTYESYIPR